VTLDGRKARMKGIMYLRGPLYANIGWQICIASTYPVHGLAYRLRIEMNNLPGCMHTGIRSASTNNANRMIRDTGQRLLDTPLHGAPFGLALPAEIIGTIVFNAKGDAHAEWVRCTSCRRRDGMLLRLTGRRAS
jgi:hypothetical protein